MERNTNVFEFACIAPKVMADIISYANQETSEFPKDEIIQTIDATFDGCIKSTTESEGVIRLYNLFELGTLDEFFKWNVDTPGLRETLLDLTTEFFLSYVDEMTHLPWWIVNFKLLQRRWDSLPEMRNSIIKNIALFYEVSMEDENAQSLTLRFLSRHLQQYISGDFFAA